MDNKYKITHPTDGGTTDRFLTQVEAEALGVPYPYKIAEMQSDELLNWEDNIGRVHDIDGCGANLNMYNIGIRWCEFEEEKECHSCRAIKDHIRKRTIDWKK